MQKQTSGSGCLFSDLFVRFLAFLHVTFTFAYFRAEKQAYQLNAQRAQKNSWNDDVYRSSVSDFAVFSSLITKKE